MPSTSLNLATKRTFDFANLATSGTISMNLRRALDVGHAKEVQLVVRVHAHGVASTNTIEVVAEQVSLTREEPETDFVGLPVSVATLSSATGAAPLVLIGTPSGNPLGHMLRVRVKGSKLVSAAIWATLSVDLIVHDD